MTTLFRACVLAALVACGFVTPASASAVDVVGTWKGAMETQIGKVPVTITITAVAPVAGQVTLDQFSGKVENATLDGDKLAFAVTIEHGTLKFSGTVAGDEMTLTVVGTRGDTMPLVVTRQK